MKLLSDRIQEFIDWLKEMTEFGDWDETIQDEVHKKLIVMMISDKEEKEMTLEEMINALETSSKALGVWEEEFIASIKEQLEEGKKLSERQRAVLRRIYEEKH